MEVIRLIGRNSRLSLLQLEIVKRQIETLDTNLQVQIITRDTRGDVLQNVPLHTVEGSDFFTKDIFDSLQNGSADIAVHSLKDLSSEHFFSSSKFAVVDRDDTRDIAIFNQQITNKIMAGEPVVIGTCSPRRNEMAIGFLQKALPYFGKPVTITTKDIRGNVDTRLRKLDSGEYDGTILATAGLNRLLKSQGDAPVTKELLNGKKLMFLPLIECVPAPCQGAIVAEADPSNKSAVSILDKINKSHLLEACIVEKRMAMGYGVGCLQKFGVTTISFGNSQVIYAAGRDSEGTVFEKWSGLPELTVANKEFFSATDFMGKFFDYQSNTNVPAIPETTVYVANYKAVEREEMIAQLAQKRVWASGTRTWFELAKKGLWVEGCADAFGLEFLASAWQMPLLGIAAKDVGIVTSNEAADIWQAKGWPVYQTYSAIEKSQPALEKNIKAAEIIFWTSYRQYLQYKDVLRPGLIHLCSFGETAQQFKQAGIDVIVFPNIKAFQQWRQTFIRSRSVA